MGIVQSLRKKDKRGPVRARSSQPKPADSPPPLMMLVPDAGGIAAFQLNIFPSARSAELFIDSTLRGQYNEGTILFWALNWQPSPGATSAADAEPLVLIRDPQRAVVYPFSFSDLDSSQEFVRQEMNRGLELGQVMIYWAVPARVEIDFWGRSSIVPPAAPKRGLVPVPRTQDEPAGSRENGHRYLTEADIAEAVRVMNEIANPRVIKMPEAHSESAPAEEDSQPTPVIDFPTASQRLQQSKSDRGVATAWANFALALDEALDAHVVHQVRSKLAWNRIMRALGDAVRAQQRLAAAAAWRNASVALAEAAAIALEQDSETDVSTNATDAPRLTVSPVAARRAWLNSAWALEEAVYARALEQKARSIRAWRFAAMALAEALHAQSEHEAALRRGTDAAWGVLAAEIALAAEAQVSRDRAILAWQNAASALEDACRASAAQQQRSIRAWSRIAQAIEEALEEQTRRDAAIAAWSNIGSAVQEAALAHHHEMDRLRAVAAWGNATIGIQEAIVAEAKLRIAQSGLDRKHVAEVERAVKTRIIPKPARRAAARRKTDAPSLDILNRADDDDVNKRSKKQSKGNDQDPGEPAPAIPDIRRDHDAARWEPREEPFKGFRSPPGRF